MSSAASTRSSRTRSSPAPTPATGSARPSPSPAAAARSSINGRNGILNSLRSSKEQGQSNFNNPGTMLLGVGADFDLTPSCACRPTSTISGSTRPRCSRPCAMQGTIRRDIGWDLSAAAIWRPQATQNLVFRLSGAVLQPRHRLSRPVRQLEPRPALLFGPAQRDRDLLMRAAASPCLDPARLLVAALSDRGTLRATRRARRPVARDYRLVRAAPAPRTQEWADAEAKSAGCSVLPHRQRRAHHAPIARGRARLRRLPWRQPGDPPARQAPSRATPPTSPRANQAHVLPRYPAELALPVLAPIRGAATPCSTARAPEFVRFINPSDYRVARDSCGACHIEIDRGGRALADVDGRDAVGRRGLQ